MTFNEFFDVMDQIGDTKFVSIGYVTGANLDVPQVKRRNPETNRMKGYDDYSVFGEGISALVQITTYNFQYRSREGFGKSYAKYKQDLDNIRTKYGLEPVRRKENDYKQKQEYGKNGIDFYKGEDENKQGRTYIQQNLFNARPQSVVYPVYENGNIINKDGFTKEQIKPFLKKSRPIDGVNALRKMNADEQTIQNYIDEVGALKMKVRTFESSSILFAVATVNGEKIIYINDKLSRAVNGINIQPQTFVDIVKEKYKEAISESKQHKNMKKTVIKLTESDIHNIVMNTVRSLIKEEPLMPDVTDDGETDMTIDAHKTTGNYTNDARILLVTLSEILDEIDEQQPGQDRQDALWNEFMEKLEHLNDIADNALNDASGNIVDTEYEEMA